MSESRPSSMFSQRRVCSSRVEFSAQSVSSQFCFRSRKSCKFSLCNYKSWRSSCASSGWSLRLALWFVQTSVARSCRSHMHWYCRFDCCASNLISFFDSGEGWPRHQGASTGAGLGNAFLSNVRAVDGIFQVVRAFDDAEVIHVEGEVNPIRDMEIIQTELRLKDVEWVDKALDNLKKTGRSLGNNSLVDKAKKEEIVGSTFIVFFIVNLSVYFQATVEKIHKVLTVDNKDIRKAEWNNKEASPHIHLFVRFLCVCMTKKSFSSITQLFEKGVTPHR